MKKVFTLILSVSIFALYAQLPQAYTLGSNPLGSHNFNFYGAVNGYGNGVQYSFVYSTDPGFASSTTTPVQNKVIDSLQVVWATVNGLTANSTYYYYVSATTVQGTTQGNTMNFFTDTTNFIFENLGADIYGNTYCELNGKIEGALQNLSLSFEWGATPILDSIASSNTPTISDANPHYFRAYPSNLTPGKTYYYRVKALGATDSFYTDIRAFYMGNPFTTLQLLPASNITSTTADMNGLAQGFPVPVKLKVEIAGTNPVSHFHSPFSYYPYDTALIHYTYHASNLTNQLYDCRYKADTWIGNFYPNDVMFFVGNHDSIFQTQAAVNVTSNSAGFKAFAKDLHFQSAINVDFEYGTTPALGTTISSGVTINDANAYTISTPVNGLSPNTLYYYRVVGNVQYNPPFYGDVMQFTTTSTGLPGEIKALQDVLVYPNPANDYIMLATGSGFGEKATVQLLGLNGQLIKETQLPANQSAVSISTAGLESGFYLLKLVSGSNTVNRKITVVK